MAKQQPALSTEAALREAAREAREVLKDMKQAQREVVETLLKLADVRERIVRVINYELQEEITRQIKPLLDDLAVTMSRAGEKRMVDTIKKYNELLELLETLGGRLPEEATVSKLARRLAKTGEYPAPLGSLRQQGALGRFDLAALDATLLLPPSSPE